MAVEQNFEWDEDAINALYRAYQRSRDGVEYRRYQPILEAAREMAARPAAEAEMMEQRMDVIRAAAREQVLDQRLPDSEPVARNTGPSALEKSIDRAKSSLFDSIAGFIDSLSPRQWVPVAVTAALAVAVVPFVLDTDPGQSTAGNLASHSGFLSTESAGVAVELDRLRDFQLGFSSSSSDYARAFSAGVLFTDVIGLEQQTGSTALRESIAELSTLSGQPINAGNLATLGDQLQTTYSQSNHWSVFVFGQWVETGYLLSRLALKTDIGEASGQARSKLTALLKDRDEIVSLLKQADHYDPRLDRDMERLSLTAADGTLDVQELKIVGNVFLKLRTVESKQLESN